MADYKESSITGTVYHRFSRIVVDNPRGAEAHIICVEQEVVVMPDREIVRDIGNLGFMFDPGKLYPEMSPITGEPTGNTITGADIHRALFSAVMAEATERDAAVTAAKEAAIAAAAAEAEEAARQAAEHADDGEPQPE